MYMCCWLYRIVWRFAKARKTGLLTWKAKSELVNMYMKRFVSPFFDSHFLVNPKIIEMAVNDVHHLAKVSVCAIWTKFFVALRAFLFSKFSYLQRNHSGRHLTLDRLTLRRQSLHAPVNFQTVQVKEIAFQVSIIVMPERRLSSVRMIFVRFWIFGKWRCSSIFEFK